MAKILKEDIDALNQVLTITIEKSDIENSISKTLNKHRKDSNLKGFRKGKAPMSYIKKLFGKQVLADEINKTLNEQMTEVLKEVDIFGDPLANENQEDINFDPNKIEDYTFKFDLGLVPEFDTQGVSKDNSYKGYKVKLSDKVIEKELLNARKRHGNRTEIEDDTIQITDLIGVSAKELDGGTIKEGGIEKTFSIAVDLAKDNLVKELSTKKKGDTFRLNVYDIEKDSSKEIIRQYVLGIDVDNEEVGEMFECTIDSVSRIDLAELDQEFFDKQFGKDVVKDLDEAKAKFRIDIGKSFTSNAEALLFKDIQDQLIDTNQFPLPETFLKRWIKHSNEKDISDEQIEREFPIFSKELRWSVIKGKLIKQYELQVTEEELQQGFIGAIKRYGMMGIEDEVLRGYAQRMMSDEQAVRRQAEEIMGSKLFTAVTSNVTVDYAEVDEKEMEEIIKEANKRMEEENAKYKAALETENEVEA